MLSSVICVILSLFSTGVSGLATLTAAPYKEIDLARYCRNIQTKQSLYLHNQAHRFIFNSSNNELIKCHLELHLHSKIFGFSVFIDSMRLEEQKDCSRDFFQFGRDFIVFTSHKSERRCGTIPPWDTLSFVNQKERLKAIKSREYIEADDTEMDLWLAIYPSKHGEPNKELSLVVTPFKKKCTDNDNLYRKCPGSEKCIKQELFCDGLVNCDGDPKDEQEEYCLINSSINNVDMFLSIPIIILIVIFVILGVMFIIFMIRLLYVTLRQKNDHNRTQEADRRVLRDVSSSSPRSNHDLDTSSQGLISLQSRLMPGHDMTGVPGPPSAPPGQVSHLPPHPPSYNEAVGVDYKDDPPKYSEVPEESHMVIYKTEN